MTNGHSEWYRPRLAAAVWAIWGTLKAVHVAALFHQDFTFVVPALCLSYGTLFAFYIAYYIPIASIRARVRGPKPGWRVRQLATVPGLASLTLFGLWFVVTPFEFRPSAYGAIAVGITVTAAVLVLSSRRSESAAGSSCG
jgi:hypothetical protein